MNQQLNELYHIIYDIEQNQEPRMFVSIVDPVIESLVAGNNLSQNADYQQATKLLTDYGIHLANLKKFNKAIIYLNKAAQLTETKNAGKGKNIASEPLYELILLYRGVAYYNTKKYKFARNDLGRLADVFPQNVKYKNWYNKSVTTEMRMLQFIVVGILAIDIVVFLYNRNSENTAHTISYSVLVGCIVCAFIVDMLKRKRKKK